MDVNFKKTLESTVKLLTPICRLINSCQDPKKNIADGTQRWVTLKLNKQQDEETNRKQEEILQNRIFKAISDMGYGANLVHPKYQGKSLDEDPKAEGLKFFEEKLCHDGLTQLNNFFRK